MSNQSVRKSLRIAAFTLLSALGLSSLPAPAQAQVVPYIQHCFVPGGAQGVFNCSVLQIQKSVTATPNCGGPTPWLCGFTISFSMSAKLVPNAGVRVVSAEAVSINPANCRLTPTSSSPVSCSLGTTVPPQLIRMTVVTVPAGF